MAMTLTEFLLARIAEDEASCGPEDEHGLAYCDADEGAHYPAARVLAECEAKRRIVELHQLMDYDQPYRGTPCCERCTAGGEYPADDGDTDEQNWPCPTLRALALPYADHPDYREEWKP